MTNPPPPKGRFRIIRTKSAKVNVDARGSKHSGFRGFYEKLLRRFKFFTQIATLLPLYVLASICLGLAISPAIYVFRQITLLSMDFPEAVQIFAVGFSIALGLFIFGLSLLIVAPTCTFILRAYPKPHRGPYFSVEFVNWYIHNGLTYLMRYTFLEFITPTPFNLLFYKLMGMKIGKDVQINTTNISDPCLIELGDRVTIGGSATITAHYGQGGFLVLAPTKIGANVTLGLKCTVMGGVTIGDDAKILPNSVVLPKTKIPAGEIWGGVPAVRIG